ncbi:radical SAM protein [Chloroflexota bacterium]
MKETVSDYFELGPIRPPSEAYSLLLRVTRNCSWNRCKFCGLYKGQKFELRTVEEIKQEISAVKVIHDEMRELAEKSGYGGRVEEVAAMLYNNPPNDTYRNVALWLYTGGKNVFLQDANTLIMRTNDLVEVIKCMKETFPSVERITSYGRSKTAARKSPEELIALRGAGLSRLHIGLESGCDALLEYMEKGVTAADHIAGGKKVVASGISLSEYVVLGLGGRKYWRNHAMETAEVLNEIDPDFIRVRTLTINKGMPLYREVENGNFIRSTDEEILDEEKLFIEHLECGANFISDHITNLLQEIEGKLPGDKEKMLAVISRLESLDAGEKTNFIVGRRAGLYDCLDDLDDTRRHEVAERLVCRIGQGDKVDKKEIFGLMERFV